MGCQQCEHPLEKGIHTCDALKPGTQINPVWRQIRLGINNLSQSSGMMDQMGSNTYIAWLALWDLHNRILKLENGSD